VPNDSFYTATMTMSGGIVTNEAGRTGFFGIGIGKALGTVEQSGGTIAWPTADPLASAIVGMGGGTGVWRLTGGDASIGANVYVGGVTTNELGVYWKPVSLTAYISTVPCYPNAAKGTLAIANATVKVGGDIVLSGDGEGTLELGLGGRVNVAGNLDARTGSKLVVDARGISGRGATLATFGGTTAAFDAANVTFLKDDGSEYELRILPRRIRVRKPMGSILIVR